jgi:hypothetical protein
MALRLQVEALEGLARVRHFTIASNIIEQIGEIVLEMGRPEIALTLIVAGATNRARIGAMTPIPTIARMDKNKETARSLLSPEVADMAVTKGGALDFDDAVELAAGTLNLVGV